MSSQDMIKYNVKSVKEVKDGVLLCSTDGDEWLLKRNNTLLHISHNNKRGNVMFHYQKKVKSLEDCLKYIKWHTQKLTNPSPKKDRLNYLFSLI